MDELKGFYFEQFERNWHEDEDSHPISSDRQAEGTWTIRICWGAVGEFLKQKRTVEDQYNLRKKTRNKSNCNL